MNARLVAVVVLALASVQHASAQKAFAPAKLYAELFADGTTIALRGNRAAKEANRMGGAEMQTRAVDVECKVSRVRAGADAVVADLTCDKETSGLAGTYGATAKGVFRIGHAGNDVAANASAVEAGYLVMPAVPKAGTIKHGKPNEAGAFEDVIAKRTNGFCRVHKSLIGDFDQQRYCFVAGRLTEFGAENDAPFPFVVYLAR